MIYDSTLYIPILNTPLPYQAISICISYSFLMFIYFLYFFLFQKSHNYIWRTKFSLCCWCTALWSRYIYVWIASSWNLLWNAGKFKSIIPDFCFWNQRSCLLSLGAILHVKTLSALLEVRLRIYWWSANCIPTKEVRPSPGIRPVSWGCRICRLHLCRWLRPPPPTCVWDMTLNCIWWWGSNSWTLGNVEYLFKKIFFLVITPRSTLTRSGSTYQSPI